MGETYTLSTWQWFPLPRYAVFEFFADARNLERITPNFLRFRVLTPDPIDMRPGTLIDYRLRLRGLPLRWRTQISDWEPPRRFVDLQLKGPYYEWHHTHTFEEQDGGTLVADAVRYQLFGPWFATRLINAVLVSPDTSKIFAYRHDALERALGVEGRTRRGPVRTGRDYREAVAG